MFIISFPFFPTQLDNAPQILDIPNHMPIQATQICYRAVYSSCKILVQTRYPSKSWVFKSRSSFKLGNMETTTPSIQMQSVLKF